MVEDRDVFARFGFLPGGAAPLTFLDAEMTYGPNQTLLVAVIISRTQPDNADQISFMVNFSWIMGLRKMITMMILREAQVGLGATPVSLLALLTGFRCQRNNQEMTSDLKSKKKEYTYRACS